MPKEIQQEPELNTLRLQDLMNGRGLKAAQLAEYSGVSYNLLYKLLRGDERPNITASVVAKLAQYFGCSVDYLMGITDNPLPMRNGLPEFLESLAMSIEGLSPQRRDDLQRIIAALRDADENDRLHTIERIRLHRTLLNAFRDAYGEAELSQLIDMIGLNRILRRDDIDALLSDSDALDEGGNDE